MIHFAHPRRRHFTHLQPFTALFVSKRTRLWNHKEIVSSSFQTRKQHGNDLAQHHSDLVHQKSQDALHTFAYSITSLFSKPEQGINDFELLSRGTLFLTPTSPHFRKETGLQYHLLTTAHILYPFLFKNLYPEDQFGWLYFLNKKDVVSKLQLRKPNGELTHEFNLSSRTIVHPNRDLIALHLADEKYFISTLKEELNQEVKHLQLLDLKPRAEKNIIFVGYDLVPRDQIQFMNEENDDIPDWELEQILVPNVVKGMVQYIREPPHNQVFAVTPKPVQYGMCGAPVIEAETILDENYKDRNFLKCVGMLEGLVEFNYHNPDRILTEAQKKLQHNAAYIPSQELIRFIEYTEANYLKQ